jgi:hypothetical protein
MSESPFRPKAREQSLLVEPVDGELIILDEERNQAHLLNPIAAEVWRACDGRRDIPALQAHCALDQDVVQLALDGLRSRHLLEASGPDGVSRRAMLRRSAIVGAGLGVAIPIIRSITVPTPAMATSFKCFTSDTEVLLGDGKRRPIGLLGVGDEVLARDERSGETGVGSVSRVFRHLVDGLLVLGLASGEEVRTTVMHPFATSDGRFVAAGSLEPGAVLAGQGSSSTLRSVRARGGRHEVFNLEVDGFHTYFVGDDALWVHNKG